MKFCFAVALALTVASHAFAQESKVDRLEIVAVGLFEAKVAKIETTPGVPAEEYWTAADEKFYSTSTRVPAQLGKNFGVLFRVVGAPAGALTTIVEIMRFPEPGLHDTSTGKTYREARLEFQTAIGATPLRGYSFGYDWELVPGDWTFEWWSGSRKLLSQTFTVYRP